MPLSERKTSQIIEFLKSDKFAESYEAEREGRLVDPYQYSSLKYWLKLETWTIEEGIYLLSGLDPKTVEKHPLQQDISKFDDALPLDKHSSFQLDPTEMCGREEFPGSDVAFQSYLEAYEIKKEVLDRHRSNVSTLDHILSRSVNGLGEPATNTRFEVTFRPLQFMRWAKAIDFKIPWIDSPTAVGIVTQLQAARSEDQKPLSTRERDTLLVIIAVLCEEAGHDYNKHAKSAGAIQHKAAAMGISIGETTIEGHLKKIPDALRIRLK